MDKQHWHLCIPDFSSFISGGNIYNEALFKKSSKIDLTFHFDLDQLPSFREEDIVFVDTLYMESFLDKRIHKPLNTVLIVHHLTSLFPPESFDASKELKQLQSFKRFLVSSYFTKDYLIKNGISEDRIVVIVPVSKIQPRSNVPALKHPIKILLVANLLPRKGILPFLNELKLWPQELLEKIEVSIVGEEQLNLEFTQQLKAMVQEFNLQEVVQFKGAIQADKMEAVYYTHDLFISVAEMETFGMAIQEAHQAGLGVLTLKKGGTIYHIDHETVLGFEKLQELSDALKNYIQFPEVLARFLEQSYLKARTKSKRSWERELDNLRDFLNNNVH